MENNVECNENKRNEDHKNDYNFANMFKDDLKLVITFIDQAL